VEGNVTKNQSPSITHIGKRSGPQGRNSFLPYIYIAKEKQIKQYLQQGLPNSSLILESWWLILA